MKQLTFRTLVKISVQRSKTYVCLSVCSFHVLVFDVVVVAIVVASLHALASAPIKIALLSAIVNVLPLGSNLVRKQAQLTTTFYRFTRASQSPTIKYTCHVFSGREHVLRGTRAGN